MIPFVSKTDGPVSRWKHMCAVRPDKTDHARKNDAQFGKLAPHCPRFLIGFLLVLVTLSLSSQRIHAGPDDHEDVRKYLNQVKHHLQQSYLLSDGLSSEQLLNTGKEEVVKWIRKEAENNSARAFLLKRLEHQKLETVGQFVHLLTVAEQRFGSARVDVLSLADAMASGMIHATDDPFSRIMTLEDIRNLRKRLRGKEASRSLGLHLREAADGTFRINFVQYRSAAYRAGLRAGDRVLAIGERKPGEVTEAQRLNLLRAGFGTTTEVRVLRDGWDRAKTFKLHQLRLGVPTVESRMLPERVGYVRLTRFGLNAADRLESKLQDLREKGMERIILDLRNNPGGALPVAVDVVDLFVSGTKRITTVRSKYRLNSFWLRLVRRLLGYEPLSGTRYAETSSPFERMDLAVLVNSSSASASELTAGALQDHDRAVLVGQNTFGKGVGQVTIPLSGSRGLGETTDLGWFDDYIPTRFLHLTVLTFHLPSGRSIHGEGVSPDVTVTDPEQSERVVEARLRLRQSDLLSSYVKRRIAGNEDLFRELARYDGFDPDRYPGFKELIKKVQDQLGNELGRSELRQELRRAIRGHITFRERKPFVVDLQADSDLQAALLELSDHGKEKEK